MGALNADRLAEFKERYVERALRCCCCY